MGRMDHSPVRFFGFWTPHPALRATFPSRGRLYGRERGFLVTVKVQGKTFELRYDLATMEMIEDEFGSQEKMREAMKAKSVKSMRTMFRIMANSARDVAGLPALKAAEVDRMLKHATLAEVNLISQAFTAAMEEGMKSETTGGNEADDEVSDEYLKEIEAKNGRAGGRRG